MSLLSTKVQSRQSERQIKMQHLEESKHSQL